MDIEKRLEEKKKRLGLLGASDKEILIYSLKCSQELKQGLKMKENNVDYSNLVKVVGQAEEVILNKLSDM